MSLCDKLLCRKHIIFTHIVSGSSVYNHLYKVALSELKFC